MEIIGYDTETWSSNQISEGLEHYFADPNFSIVCAGWASKDGIATNDDVSDLRPGNYGRVIAAHNAHFDRSAVDAMYGNGVADMYTWLDTMVAVRAILGASLGRASYLSLDKSAKLLLPEEYHKDKAGADLMEYFSYPSPKNNFGKIPWRVMKEKYPHLWEEYMRYCGQDSMVARQLALLAQEYLGSEAFDRLVYEAEITYRMNRQGWPVDTKLLQVMTDRAQENTEGSLDRMIEEYNPGWATVKRNGDEQFKPLNLNSGVQLRKWLAERGVNIENAQADTITETIDFVEDSSLPDKEEILAVLQTKVDLGGATLKKLTPIAKGVSADGRLRHMYNHIAASSTHRTTGSGVQMQNLKRLPDDIEDLTEDGIKGMNNNELAKNIRQLFKAQDDGEIIVADLKSIEGLLVGWVFGVDWMVKAVKDGLDMYKMSAAERFGVPYVSVLPEQRRQAKTGVLAGNYGGSTKAYVKASGNTLSDKEASQDVSAYRKTVPNLVQSWWDLNDMLIETVEEGFSALRLYNGYSVTAQMLPDPLGELEDPTLQVALHFQGKPIFHRLWHGVRIEVDENDRKEITYAVAEEKKTATNLWKRTNSEGEKFRLYGGKLTGTLIQSLARELYFYQLEKLTTHAPEVRLIGQLHDEVVAEWQPGDKCSLADPMDAIETAMTLVPWYLKGCPVRVKVSHAKRYIK